MDTIGKRIRYARKINKLSLTDVKNKTGLSTGNLSELENDKFAPSSNALIAFRQLFAVSIDWLLTGESPMMLMRSEDVKEIHELYLNEEERNLIMAYRRLSKDKKRDIQGFIHVVAEERIYDDEHSNK
nr:helix-turn-helix transcriptional regulator [Sedimentibacter sp.]